MNVKKFFHIGILIAFIMVYLIRLWLYVPLVTQSDKNINKIIVHINPNYGENLKTFYINNRDEITKIYKLLQGTKISKIPDSSFLI